MSKPFWETQQRLLKFRKSKWTGKRSDGGAARVRNHHYDGGSWLCVGGNEATGGRGEQKVTYVFRRWAFWIVFAGTYRVKQMI